MDSLALEDRSTVTEWEVQYTTKTSINSVSHSTSRHSACCENGFYFISAPFKFITS